MKVLTTAKQLRSAKHEDGLMFLCSVCKETKPVQTECGTGYGYDHRNRPVCYACCGERDKAEMIKTGRAVLYLSMEGGTRYSVGNWPGTLKLDVSVRKGNHNMARTRYDAWFTGPDGKPWHGTQYGENTQICHCKRIAA